MDITKTDERDLIISLIEKVAGGVGVENPDQFDFYSRNELIEAIRQKSETTAVLLKKFLEISGTYRLIRHDQEMKVKAKEMWEYQFKLLKSELDQYLYDLRNDLSEKNILADELIDRLAQ